MLDISKLVFKQKEKLIFNDFSLVLNPGESLMLFGKNGSGKSTLLSLIAGILKPNSGFIKNSFKTSLCFQESQKQFIAPTVLDDICFTPMCEGLEAREKALELLSYFKLLKLKDAYISELSGGEKKLVALLGVFITNSQLLLLDEPLNHLDDENKKRLFALIEKDSRSFIISSHEPISFKKQFLKLCLG